MFFDDVTLRDPNQEATPGRLQQQALTLGLTLTLTLNPNPNPNPN